MSRLDDIRRLYELLDVLRRRLGVVRLRDCHGRQPWPKRGVYFFFEDGEERSTSGSGPRVVRIGTHALTSTSRTTLWNRLSQHRGVAATGAGNHRGSIFRLLVGEALLRRDGRALDSWGVGQDPGAAARMLGRDKAALADREWPVELAVSNHIGSMELVYVAVEDLPGKDSMRGVIERNAIALLSNFGKEPVDASSSEWLGRFSDRNSVCRSGLWNQQHVDEEYDPIFLNVLERAVAPPYRQS